MSIREAYEASTSLNDLAGRIQCHYQTARRRALAEGLDVPAAHWGCGCPRPQPLVESDELSDEALLGLCEERGITVMRDPVREDREHECATPTFDGAGSFRVGIVTDTHAGSKYAQNTFLRAAYDEFERQGIAVVLHAGDLTGGSERMHPGITYELYAHGADEQIALACQTIPQKSGITTYAISGNHDHSHMKSGGTNVVAQIARQRPDVHYLGMSGAYLTINGIRFYLHHPSGGAAYARSYRLQKQIEQFSPENKPKVLVTGHFHVTCVLEMYRNVFAFMGGCFEAQTPYLVEKGLYPEIGFSTLDVTYDDDGAVRFKKEFIPLYVPKEGDYR